jgi:hypothetical protein
MRKSTALAVGLFAMLMTASGGTAQSEPLSIKNFDNRPYSLITPIVEGTHCYVCVVRTCTGPDLSRCTCEKWEEVSCGDIIVKNVAGASAYVDRKTGKPVWLKGMRAPTAPSKK